MMDDEKRDGMEFKYVLLAEEITLKIMDSFFKNVDHLSDVDKVICDINEVYLCSFSALYASLFKILVDAQSMSQDNAFRVMEEVVKRFIRGLATRGPPLAYNILKDRPNAKQ